MGNKTKTQERNGLGNGRGNKRQENETPEHKPFFQQRKRSFLPSTKRISQNYYLGLCK